MTKYTRDHMEAACCLWEAMLEMKEKNVDLGRAFMKYGTAALRDAAIDLAIILDEEWNELTQEMREDAAPFDWEYTPNFVSRVDWTQWPPIAAGEE
jgi:hypothetical protein